MHEEKITVKLKDRPYNIFIKEHILPHSGKYLQLLNIGKKILIVTQNKVPSKFIKLVKASLNKSGYKAFTLVLPSGESYKNLNSVLKIINFVSKNKFERNDSFCAIGGGVISDLTGFASSIYNRGLNFLCIPTTLLGMVDAAIGGKTAVNTKEGKNLLGTFYQPRIILIDPTCLKTLSQKEYLVGLGEVIKYALLEKTAKLPYSKKGFFHFLKQNKKNILQRKTKFLLKIIFHSASIKALIVSKDEKESGLRSILNLGHTFAHGIEKAYNYKKYTHGEAVSIGMCLASKLAEKHSFIPKQTADSIINLISSYGLPTKLIELSKVNKIIKYMMHDKKIKDGKLRFILSTNEIGKVKIVSGISMYEIKALFKG